MAAFAEVGDLESRWRPLTPAEAGRASVLLADASVMLRAQFRGIDAKITAGTMDAGLPLLVVCDMVKRALIAPVDDPAAVTRQQTAGPFSQSVTYSNPSGDLYISKADRRQLSGGQRASFVSLGPTVDAS